MIRLLFDRFSFLQTSHIIFWVLIFLRQNALVVDFANLSLNNSLSNISWSLVKQVCKAEIPKPYLVTNDYLKVLQSFPELTKPPNRDKPVKHDVVHEIETNGYPCHARARPFTPEKLQIVQEEIDFMLKPGYITRSSSFGFKKRKR